MKNYLFFIIALAVAAAAGYGLQRAFNPVEETPYTQGENSVPGFIYTTAGRYHV